MISLPPPKCHQECCWRALRPNGRPVPKPKRRLLADIEIDRRLGALDGAALHRIEGLQAADELARREGLDLELVVGRLGDVAGEGLGGAEDGVELAREARGQPPAHLRHRPARPPASATAPAAAARPAPFRKPRRFGSGVVVLGVVIGRLPDFLVWLLLIRSERCVQRHETVMKLATLKHGRDGRLVVVSRDLTRATDAFIVAPTLQAALDDWERHGPRLADLARAARASARCPSFRFHEHDCASPLPRAYQWADGSAYVNHVELVRKARGAEMPATFWTDPLMYQGGSDSFLGPRDADRDDDEAWGIDFEGEVAVITRRRADGGVARGGRGGDPAGDARQRRVAAQPHPARARQGLRLLPVASRHRPSRPSR